MDEEKRRQDEELMQKRTEYKEKTKNLLVFSEMPDEKSHRKKVNMASPFIFFAVVYPKYSIFLVFYLIIVLILANRDADGKTITFRIVVERMKMLNPKRNARKMMMVVKESLINVKRGDVLKNETMEMNQVMMMIDLEKRGSHENQRFALALIISKSCDIIVTLVANLVIMFFLQEPKKGKKNRNLLIAKDEESGTSGKRRKIVSKATISSSDDSDSDDKQKQ